MYANTAANARTTCNLQLPTGATVHKAYLYWYATQDNGFVNPDTTVTLSRTGTGAFSSTITATQGFSVNIATRYAYLSVADVTSTVALRGNGTYRLTGVNIYNYKAQQDYVATVGWYMVVLYELASDPLRNLAVFDGLDFVNTNQTVPVTLSGFEVPQAGFDGKLGVVTLEGDSGLNGDSLQFDGNTLGTGVAGLNPNNNFFNSTRSNFGSAVSVAGDLPRLAGTAGTEAGLDLDIVDIKSYLSAGKTSATISASTTSDVFFLAGFVTSISTYKPEFSTSGKEAVDINGPPLVVGDTIEYSIFVENTGNDNSTFTVLTDPLPSQVTYVPGSLHIASKWDTDNKTDASGDDTGEYNSANRTVYCYLGDNATGTHGGRMLIGDNATVRFRVTVNPGQPGSILNQAIISAIGELGAPQEETPTDGNDNGTGQPPTEVIVDECTIDDNCSSLEPFCKTTASPKICVECLSNADCTVSPNLYCSPTTDTCVSCVQTNGGVEACDGIDNDCDGTIDEGQTQNTYYHDSDGDTYGDPADSIQACSAPPGYVGNDLDCNDADAAIKPGVTEICNNIDDDCDGSTDEGLPLNSYYRDADGDTYGNVSQVTQTCSGTPPSGYVLNSTDCNDANTAVYPGATEVCNGIDDNCAGGIDEGLSSEYVLSG